MKFAAMLVLLLALTACQHPKPAPVAAVAPPAPLAMRGPPPAAAARPAEAVYPPEQEEYYVGMIPDAEDTRFAYHPGTLVVERRPARLRLAGDEAQVVPVFHRGPITTARMADNHPDPTPEELASLALRSHWLINSLRADNQACVVIIIIIIYVRSNARARKL